MNSLPPNQMKRAAEELHRWFKNLLDLCDKTVFAVGSDDAHRGVAYLDVLQRNARILLAEPVDAGGRLYSPLCFVLAAASRRLGTVPSAGNFKSALSNVDSLARSRSQTLAVFALGMSIGSPAAIFKEHLDEAMIGAGITQHPSQLNPSNRRVSMMLVINWGLRFLIAYAMESDVSQLDHHDDARDLTWIHGLLDQPSAV